MYSKKLLEHFNNPRNAGELEEYDAVGEVGNPLCGDIMNIYIKVRDGRIADISFKTMGCAAAIATSSMITEMARGKTLEEAEKITRGDVAEALDGLPSVKMHCSNLAAAGLRKAIENFRKGRKRVSREETINEFLTIPGLTEEIANRLWDAGLNSIEELRRTLPSEMKLLKLSDELIEKIKKEVGDDSYKENEIDM
jgi:nitrogen fixation NifU-like protein